MSRGAEQRNTQDDVPYRASAELCQALFDQATDGIFIADKTGKFQQVNQSGCDALGYTREEMLTFSLKDLIPPEDLVHSPLQFDDLLAGKPLLKERRLRCKDGRLLPVEISARLLADGSLLGIVRDITERKRAEEHLRESNERFQLLAESSLTGIYLIQDGRFRYVNPAMAHIFGYEVEEIVDKLGPMELVFATDQVLVAENIRRRVKGEEEAIHYDFRGQRKDGAVIDVEVHGRRIELGGKVGVIGTLVEITERKQADTALRTSQEELQLALDAAQMGLWHWNIVTGEVVWSPKCRALYGISLDVPMSYELFVQTLHPDDRERVDKALTHAVETSTQYEETKRAVWPDGSIHWTHSRGQVYCDAAGNPVHMTGVSFDVSKWREAESEHQAHLWFLESLDKVNRAMQGTNDLEQMMTSVLDTLLTIFECDRAWLVYPCDPESATWQSMMERTRPEYPGAIPVGAKLPLDPVGAAVFKILLGANGPVQFGPDSAYPVPQVITDAFQVQSFMANVLYPKVGKPWNFGLHQCAYARVWTPEEERLLQEIGRRLADGLTSLLTYRNLRLSEHRLEKAERIAHVGWWDRDYEENRIALSDEACRIFGITLSERDFSLTEWHEWWQQLIHPEDRENAAEAAEVALRGGPRYDLEYRVIQPGGAVRVIQSQGDVTWDDAGRPLRMFGTMQDITELRQVEAELRRSREAALQFSHQLGVLHEVSNQLSLAESTDDLCRQAVQLARARLGFDRASIWFVNPEQNVLNGSYGIDENGALRDERNASFGFSGSRLSAFLLAQNESTAFVEYRPLFNHQGQQVGEGDNAAAALWDGDTVIGLISVDNLFTQQPITNSQLEILRLFATTLGYLFTRKRAEDERRASDVRFRMLIDHATDAFYLHDEEGTILDVNNQACLSLGYSREELIGLSPYQFDAAQGQAEMAQVTQQLNAGQVIALDTLHRRKDGTVFPVEVRIRPYWQGGRRLGVSLARDITERKRAQEAQERLLVQIREQAQRVQNIMDTVPEGVVLLSKDQFVTLTNRVARYYLALLAPDMANDYLDSLGPFPLSDILTSPPKGLWHEIAIHHMVFEAIARPVENSPNNGGWVLVLRDVTQERDIQNRIQRQDRLAAVGQLAAGIAHDFNNILTVIRLYTQLIARTVDVPGHAAERLHTIEQQTDRATDLIQQILDFSRQSVLERQPLDLLPFMRRLVKLLDRTLPEHISVVLNHLDDAYLIRADPSRIQQMLMNLAVNARDAMPDGGQLQVSLTHVQTAESKALPMNDLPPGSWVVLAVTDSGTGIPPEVVAHMFEPFFTTKQVGVGTGLGLAQVYGIVEQHEGYIDVVTAVGQGTTFLLYFPALNTGESPVDAPDKSQLKLGQGQTILLVEDNQSTRQALMGSLALLNYQVVVATNGREALTFLTTQQLSIDLVLSDVVMPEMGGVALFHTIREQGLDIPVVLLTGHSLSSEMENLLLLGLSGWMPKPPDLAVLSHLLAAVLASPPA